MDGNPSHTHSNICMERNPGNIAARFGIGDGPCQIPGSTLGGVGVHHSSKNNDPADSRPKSKHMTKPDLGQFIGIFCLGNTFPLAL